MKLSIRLVMEMANPLLESFGEPPRICMINSSRPPTDLKGKGNPDLPSVCSNYWPPIVALCLCFNHLVLSTFRQYSSAIPQRSAKPIASINQNLWEISANGNNIFGLFKTHPFTNIRLSGIIGVGPSHPHPILHQLHLRTKNFWRSK